MSDQLPACPQCQSEYAYENGALLVCPMCGHEWTPGSATEAPDHDSDSDSDVVYKDAVGNVLMDGDTVSVVKGLKIKGGGGGAVKAGTKVRDIRLFQGGADGHDIDAKVPGFGQMQLKSSVVKKII